MRKFFSISTITIFLLAWTILPAFAGVGRTGAQILSLGGGTRAAALGGAFSAVSGDVTSLFWNPSGSAEMDEIQTTLAYTDYSQLFGQASEGLYYALFAGAFPFGEYGVFGTTLQVQGQGVIDVTTDSPTVDRQENLGTNWVLALSYADKLSDNLQTGITGKIIHQELTKDFVSNAYAVDFGIQYTLNSLPTPITFGTAVQNWGTRVQFKDEEQSDPLPRKCKMGAAIDLVDTDYHRFRVVADLTASIDKLAEEKDAEDEEFMDQENLTWDELQAKRGVGIHAFRWGNMQKSVGAEYSFGNILALRAGYKDEPGVNLTSFDEYLTYGLGLRIMNYQFDYALTPGGGPTNNRLHTVALLFRF